MNLRYELHDLKVAPTGWTVHEYWIDDAGKFGHIERPLIGWALEVGSQRGEFGLPYDFDREFHDRPRRVNPVFWDEDNAGFTYFDEYDCMSNCRGLITGPGEKPRPHQVDRIRKTITESIRKHGEDVR